MEKYKSKQLFITSFDYPIDSIKAFFFNDKIFSLLLNKIGISIKKFIGSDWLIIGSGFIFSFNNYLNLVFSIKSIEKNDFCLIIKYSIDYFNNIKIENNMNIILSLISNTIEYSTILEFRLEYEKVSNLKYIEFPIIDKILSKLGLKIKSLFKIYCNNNKYNNEPLIINQSFIIKNYYKEAFKFFYNWKNMAKSLKTDKVWKIIFENIEDDDKKYKNFTLVINKNIKIHYKVISVNKEKDLKIELLYSKTVNSFPSLNNYIKFSFINLDKQLCYFLYETHLPLNISSSLYQIISNYLYYCNIKSKNYFEKNCQNIEIK